MLNGNNVEMEKIQLTVLGLSASPASNNAYALILKELDGNRRLPIIIGAFEAQAIALEMEQVTPPRPMTHDLLKTIIDTFGGFLSEVYINELKDGTFYAKLIFDDMGFEIDARPSDAIALAVRTNAPIFVNTSVMEESGIIPQPDEEPHGSSENEMGFNENEDEFEDKRRPRTRLDHLNSLLDKAIKDENYEKAAELRDEIKKNLESS
jgi:hypothetical protein